MEMAGGGGWWWFPLLMWLKNERGLFCCERGLGKGVVVSCSKAILLLSFLLERSGSTIGWKNSMGLEVWKSGFKFWLGFHLNVALGGYGLVPPWASFLYSLWGESDRAPPAQSGSGEQYKVGGTAFSSVSYTQSSYLCGHRLPICQARLFQTLVRRQDKRGFRPFGLEKIGSSSSISFFFQCSKIF